MLAVQHLVLSHNSPVTPALATAELNARVNWSSGIFAISLLDFNLKLSTIWTTCWLANQKGK